MKGLKILGFVVGGIAVLVAVALLVAFNASFQTWAVRKAVASQPGTTFEVTRVSAGLSGADITGLKVVQDGVSLNAKSLSARFSAWDFLTKDKLNVDSVVLEDLEVDLRPGAAPAGGPAPATAPAAGSPGRTAAPAATEAPARPPEKKTPFAGLLEAARLPLDVRIGNVSAKGRAQLPENQTVTFDLKAGGIEAGQKGTAQWTLDFADATPNADLRAARVTGTAALRVTSDRRIDLVEVDTVAAPLGPKIPSERIQVTLKAEKPAGGNDETYAATVSLVRPSGVETLLKTDARYLDAAREIAGTWELAVRSEQLAKVLASLNLPELAATGSGKFSLKPDTNAVAASGHLRAQASRLEVVNPGLAALGSVNLTAGFDAGFADDVARLDQLNFELAAADGRKFAEIRALQKISYAVATQRVQLANPQAELARVSLTALPLAWAQAFAKPLAIESGELSLVLAVEAEPDGSRVRARAVEPLALRTVTIRDAQQKLLADRVSLTVKPSLDYSETKLSAKLSELAVTLPDGDTVGAELSADVTNLKASPVVAFSAQLQAKIVSALKPYLDVPTGPLAVSAQLEGRHEGDVLQVARLTSTVNREGNALLAALELQQPVRADLKAGTFAVPDPAATALRVRLGAVPLAWAEPFVAQSKLSGQLGGGTLDVAFRSAEDVTLTTAEAVTLRGVTAVIEGKTLAQTLDLDANLTATKRGETIAYDVRRIEVKQGQTALARLQVAGEARLGAKLAVTAKGNLEADTVPLLQQPMLAPYATLARGRVTAAFDATHGESTSATATIAAKGLVAKAGNRPLGDLDLSLTADVKPDGSGKITLPLTLANGDRRSDVAIDGTFGQRADKKAFLFTGKVASSQLFVEDFQPLAGLAPAGEPAKAPAPTTPRPGGPTAPAGRDTQPFWQGVNGKAELDLKRVVYTKDYIVSARGSAVITDSKLALEGLEGKFQDKPFKLTGAVDFAAAQPKPYTLAGSVDVSGVDVGPILQAADPKVRPALETTVRVAGKFNGAGTALASLLENTTGQFDVNGGKGTLRIISGKTGAAVGVASLLGGVLGAATGSNSTVAASSLLRELTEMPFDQFTMRVERGADLSLKLATIEFISPATRITGTGSVTHQAGVPIASQPLQLELRIAGKQHMLRMLDEARVLGATVDDKGYGQMRAPFKVSGSVSQLQDNLWSVLLSTALEMRSDLQNSRTPSQQQQQTQPSNTRTNLRGR